MISLLLGYIALKENGFLDGVIYNKIDYYSNDVSVILSNVEGYISQRPKADGEYIINDGFFFLYEDKTTKKCLNIWDLSEFDFVRLIKINQIEIKNIQNI